MKKSLNNSAHILGKLGVIMLGLFFLPQVSFGAVVYEETGVGHTWHGGYDYGQSMLSTDMSCTTTDLPSLLGSQIIKIRIKLVSGPVPDYLVWKTSSCGTSSHVLTTPVNLGGGEYEYDTSDFTIPDNIKSIGFISNSLGEFSLDGSTVSGKKVYGTAFSSYLGVGSIYIRIADSGGFAPPVNTTLNKPVASSTISGFDNWNVTWTNTNESRADIFWFASSTVATDCQSHMTTGTGYDWLYYCPWATASNGGMHYKQGSVSYSSGTWTRDEPNNVQFTNGNWYAFSGLYDYTTNSYVAVSAITDFTINFNANYDVSTSTVTTAPFSTGTASSTLSLTGSSCATSGNLFAEAICVAFTFLFVPADSTLGQFSNLYSYMQSRFPWTYYYQIADVIGSVHYDSSKADASPTYSMNYHSANLHIASSTIGNFLPDFTAFSSSTVKQYFPAGTFDILKALAGTAILLVFFADMFFLMRNFFR